MKKVIILHGWAKNLDKWKVFLEELAKNGIKYSLLKIPGLTGSLEKVWRLEDYVTWLKNIVEKEKGKVILVGHSNGGRIALAFTHKFSEKVEKLILIDSAGIYHNDLYIRMKRLFFSTLARIGKKITKSQILRNVLYKLTRESDYRNASPHMKKTMTNLMKSDVSLSLSKISVPTLIIWGANDKVTPLSDGILMNNLIKNSKLEIIENTRHSPMFTHPQEVAAIIFNNLAM